MKKFSQYFLILFFLTSCFSFFVGIESVSANDPICVALRDAVAQQIVIDYQKCDNDCPSEDDTCKTKCVTDQETATNKLSSDFEDCLTNASLEPLKKAPTAPSSGVLKGVKCAGNQGTPCGLCDFIQVFVNISDMILAASGVVGFLLFIYAGILYLLVPYKPDYVSKAKTMITSVIIGLVIVFGAYTIVNFTLKTIGSDGPWSVCSETPSPAK